MLEQYQASLLTDDVESLQSAIQKGVSKECLSFLAYHSIVQHSYQCLEFLIQQKESDPYLPILADNHELPLLHHAIRLGDLHACKLILDCGIHPLVCSGQCLRPESPESLCEDAVLFSLHTANESNRRNAIAVLLQTHLYSIVSGIVGACGSGDEKSLKLLLPDDLRIQCALSTMANNRSTAPSSAEDTQTTVNAIYNLLNETNSTWTALGGAGIGKQAVASVVALGAGGMRLGKRLLSATSQKVTQAVISVGSLTNLLSQGGRSKDSPCRNLLTKTQLLSWTRSCLNHLLLLCVQHGFIDCLTVLLRAGFRVCPVPTAVLSVQINFCPLPPLSATFYVDQPLMVDQRRSASSESTIEFWAETPGGKLDTAIHAAIHVGRVDMVQRILMWDPNAISLSLPDPRVGALPLHTAAAWNQPGCLSALLSSAITLSSDVNTPEAAVPEPPGNSNVDSHLLVMDSGCPTYSCRLRGSAALYRFPFCVDQMDCYGLTPFLLAIINGHVENVRQLLELRIPVQHLPTQVHWIKQQGTQQSEDPQGELVRVNTSVSDVNGTPSDTIDAPSEPPGQIAFSKSPSTECVCPVDLSRKVSACWLYGRAGLAIQNRRLTINPREHGHLIASFVCGQFDALHLAVMSGNVELVRLLLETNDFDINALVLPCSHRATKKSLCISYSLSPGQKTIDVPVNALGLACCLAGSDEKVACSVVEALLDAGATDTDQILFGYAIHQSCFKLAGTLLTYHVLKKCISSDISPRLHLDLSHKMIGPLRVPTGFWMFVNGPFFKWIATAVRKHLESAHVNLLLNRAPEFMCISLVTRVTLSHCDLETLPWCLLGDLICLQELNLSWNKISELSEQLPPNAPQSHSKNGCEYLCWAPHLIYWDLSHNCLGSVPPWVFIPPRCSGHYAPHFSQPVRHSNNTSTIRHSSTCSNLRSLTSTPIVFAPELTHLILSQNRISTMPGEMWLSEKLCFLDLSWNLLTSLPLPTPMESEMTGSMNETQLNRSISGLDAIHGSNIQSLSLVCQSSLRKNEGAQLDRMNRYISTSFLTQVAFPNRFISSANRNSDERSQRSNQPSGHRPTETGSKRRHGLVHLWLNHNSLSALTPLTNNTQKTSSNISSRDSFKETVDDHSKTLSELAPCLQHLDASHNRIRSFPGFGFFPKALVHLDLSNNLLDDIQKFHVTKNARSRSSSGSLITPEPHVSFSRWRSRSCDKLPTIATLTDLDTDILPCLEHLNLRGNLLEVFSPLIPDCARIRFRNSSLCLSPSNSARFDFNHVFGDSPCCAWSSQCKQFSRLRIQYPRLKTLDLGNNRRLKRISSALSELSNLQQVFLDGCPSLSEIPADLWRLCDLQTLYLVNSPFENIANSDEKQDGFVVLNETDENKQTVMSDQQQNLTRRVVNRLKSMTVRAHPFNELNLVVLGPPGVGKSTLVRLLCKNEQEAAHQSHDGSQEVSAFTHPSRPPRRKVGKASHSASRSKKNMQPREPRTYSASAIGELIDQPKSGESTGLLYSEGCSPGVEITRIVISRPFQEVSLSSTSAVRPAEPTRWCKKVVFNTWDFGSSTRRAFVSEDPVNHSCASLSNESTSSIQELLYCRSTVFLVVWRLSDGIRGLNEITTWLMSIQSNTPHAPVILVGTHADLCQNNPYVHDPSRRARSLFFDAPNLNALNEAVQTRFAGMTDLASFGLPNLYGHVMFNLHEQSNPDLRNGLFNLATLIHKAANTILLPVRIASSMFVDPVRGPNTCLTLLSLPIPHLYRQVIMCTRQLLSDLHDTSRPPVMLVDGFLKEIDLRLRRQFSADRIPIRQPPHGSVEHPNKTVGNHFDQVIFLTQSSHGFASREEAMAVLVFLNEFGIVRHFSESPLQHLVFLSPAWLINLLFRFGIELGRTRLGGTVFVRRGCSIPDLVGPVSSNSSKVSVSNPRANTAVINLSTLRATIRSCLDCQSKETQSNGEPSPGLNLFLDALIPLLAKVRLIGQWDSSHFFLPSLLSARSVRPVVPSLSSSKSQVDQGVAATPQQNGENRAVNAPVKYSKVYPSRKFRMNPSIPPKISRRRYSFNSPALSSPECRLLPPNGGVPESVNPRLVWAVHTVACEEIVRVYSMSYIPLGFWSRLASRLLTDSTVDEVCSQIYSSNPLPVRWARDKLPIELQLPNTFQQSPEWTVWKHGMRLSLADGKIGLARLQQFTKGPCALHRSYWTNSRGLPSTPESHLCQADEWEEFAASEGEEALPESNLFPSSLPTLDSVRRASLTRSLMLESSYRTGVVGAPTNTYQGRKVHLFRWLPADARKKECDYVHTTDDLSKRASAFAIRSDGNLVFEDNNKFESSCLIELHIPSHWLHWRVVYDNAHCGRTVRSDSAPSLSHPQPKKTNSAQQQQFVKPNRQAIAKLLAKIVDHMDHLLEDWYPDLGTRFRQANDGSYLVDRIIPCCVCLASVPTALSSASRLDTSSPVNEAQKHRNFRLKHRQSQTSTHSNPAPSQADTDSDDREAQTLLDSSVGHRISPLDRSVSSGQVDCVDPNNLVVGLGSSEHHLTVQSTVLPKSQAMLRIPWSKLSFLKRIPKRAQSVDATHIRESDTPPAYSSVVYAISVSDYIHWMFVNSPVSGISGSPTEYPQFVQLCCPRHPTVPFQAPDLRFDDLNRELLVPASRVQLVQFLGRGAFASVFTGLLHTGEHTDDQLTETESDASSNNDTVPIALKLSSPADPRLQTQNHESDQHESDSAGEAGNGRGNMRDALLLFNQEQRRWALSPVEACSTAYQEVRAELNVLVRIMSGLGVRKFSSPRTKRMRSSNLFYMPSRFSSVNRVYKRLLSRPNNSLSDNLSAFCDYDANGGGRSSLCDLIRPHHLLVCLGLIALNPLGVILPLAPNGNLSDYLKFLSEECADKQCSVDYHAIHPITITLAINQIATALAYLHNLDIVHRDVKLDNLLVWDMPRLSRTLPSDPRHVHIVLMDYGASQLKTTFDGCRGYVGTAGYMAPEILKYLGEETYTEKVDIYSLGIIICELVKTEPAYKQCVSTRFHLDQRVLAGIRPDIPPDKAAGCPSTILDLMYLCWHGEPSVRPSASSVAQLTTPWWQFVPKTPHSPPSTQQSHETGVNVESCGSPECKISAEMNGCYHIRSVHRLDTLDVVTCALFDPENNLWLGGYRHLSRATNSPKSSTVFSSVSVCSANKVCPSCSDGSLPREFSQREGLLLLTSLPSYNNKTGNKRSGENDPGYQIVDIWPLNWVACGGDTEGWERTPCGPKSFTVRLDDTCPDWPQRMCRTNQSVGSPGSFFVNCVTAAGYLCIYSYPSMTRLMKIRLYFGTESITKPVKFNATRWACSLLLLVSTETIQEDTSRSPPKRSSTLHYHLVLGLETGHLGLVTVWVHKLATHHSGSSQSASLSSVSWINERLVSYAGLFLPTAFGSQLWLGQSDSRISTHTLDSASSKGRITQCEWAFRPLDSWTVSTSPETGSVVNALLIEPMRTSLEENSAQSCAESGTKECRVWSYLCPKRELTCWSTVSRTALRSIQIGDLLPNSPAGWNHKHAAFSRYDAHMDWLDSSNILISTTDGRLMRLQVYSSGTFSSDSTQSTQPALQFFRYHGDCTTLENFTLVACIKPLARPDCFKLPLIYTLGRGFRSPLRSHLSSSSLFARWNRRDFTEQQSFYVVSLFCDKFLFP